MTAPSRDGFVLMEVLVALVLLGIVTAATSSLIIATLRTSAVAERRAVRTSIATTALAIAERVVVSDPCDSSALMAPVLARVDVPTGWDLSIMADCTVPAVVVLEVVVVDDTGRTLTLDGAR